MVVLHISWTTWK